MLDHDSHHVLEHKLVWDPKPERRFPQGRREQEHTDVNKALRTCGYPNWAFTKSVKMQRKVCQTPTRKKQNDNNFFVPVA